MADTLSRVTTFVPATPILSAEVNGELNQLVNLLNGTSSSIKGVFKVDDAGDAPIEVNQLGVGPIQKWFQGGILKATMGNDGSLSTDGNIVLSNANPSITFNDTAGTDAKIDHDASILRFGSTALNMATLDLTTSVMNFIAIPTGPAADPTLDNQFARAAYVNSRRTKFTFSFGVASPSVPTVNQVIPGMISWVCPASTSVVVRKVRVKYEGGSHAGGTSVTFSIQRRRAADSWATPTTLYSISLDDTNNTKFVVYTSNVGPTTFIEGDTLIVFISARTGTVTEQDVSVIVEGDQAVLTAS